MMLARAGSSQDGKGILCIQVGFLTSAGNRIARLLASSASREPSVNTSATIAPTNAR